MSSAEIFEPDLNDSSSVREALLAALGAHRRGEPREALRCLRQAAEGAESDGNDARALALARAAADLANELGASVPPPPSYSPPPAVRAPSGEPELEALIASGRAVRVLV